MTFKGDFARLLAGLYEQTQRNTEQTKENRHNHTISMGIHTHPYIYCNMITNPKTVAQGETTDANDGVKVKSGCRSCAPVRAIVKL